MKKIKSLILILQILSYSSDFLASTVNLENFPPKSDVISKLEEIRLAQQTVQLIINFYKKYYPKEIDDLAAESTVLVKLLDNAEINLNLQLQASSSTKDILSSQFNRVTNSLATEYKKFINEYIKNIEYQASEQSEKITAVFHSINDLITTHKLMNITNINLLAQGFNKVQSDLHTNLKTIKTLLGNELTMRSIKNLNNNIEKNQELLTILYQLLSGLIEKEDNLNIPLNFPRQGLSDNVSDFLSSSSNFIFGQNIPNDYWYFYNLKSKLSKFKEMPDRIEKELFLSKIFNTIYTSYQQATMLLFIEYSQKEENMLEKLKKSMPTGVSIISVPSEKTIQIVDPQNKILTLLQEEKTPKPLGIEKLFSLKAITIPTSMSKYKTALSETIIKNIEYIWFGNLEINTIYQNKFYDLFENISLYFKKVSQKINEMEIIHSQIHQAYIKDLATLKKSYNAIIDFVVDKFKESSNIKTILYNDIPPFTIRLILKSDDITEETRITNSFRRIIELKISTPDLPEDLPKKMLLSPIRPISFRPIS